MDDAGNMALGYSVSSSTMYPSIRYSGRLTSDTLNSLPQGEATLIAGTGSQTSTSYRWGDYSMLGLDPQDGCTFWYTNEYYTSPNSATAWKTRIGSFKFPSCTALPTGNLNGTVTDGANPLAGVNVDANGYVTVTDASGHYSIDLPAGSYNVTASKYGYSSSSASGVTVTAGGSTTQNFTLGTATFHNVSGVVTNAVTGWPLYASISISGYPNSPIFTDPLTGAYTVTLADGGPYIFTVNAMGGGYSTGSAYLTVSVDATQNFSLTADLASCTAPGYNYIPGALLYSEGFNPASGLPADWTSTRTAGSVTTTAWTTATATVNPSGIPPYEGTRLAYFNSWTVAAGNAARLAKTTGYDLSGQSNAQISIYVYHDAVYSDADTVQMQVSTDGTTWNNVGDPIARYDGSTGWKRHVVNINAYTGAGKTNIRPGFNATGQYGNDVHIDNMTITNLDQCNPYAGLVVGTAYDANTSAAIDNAAVTDGTHNATWVDNTLDAAQPHPMYITGEPVGAVSLTASAFHYANDTRSPTVVSGGVVRQNFSLAAGSLSATPSSLNFAVFSGSSTNSQTTNLANAGGASADYEVFAIPGTFGGYAPTGPYADNTRHLGPKNLNDLDASALRIPPEMPEIPALAAGNVTTSWSTGLTAMWGLGYNTEANDLWLGNIAAGGGDNKAYRFTTAGVNTGDTIAAPWITTYAADMTYNPFTNKLWQVNVGGDNCIYEMDPAVKVSTGSKICPAFGTSERGLAFDPVTNTYYAGSWNDYIINHFAPDGTMLDSKVVNLSIAGLAYNPGTRHLFVLSNTDSTTTPTHYDVTVLDTANSYAVVGGFNLLVSGVEAFANNTQSGLEIDCNGNLWASSYAAKKVFVAASGETGVCNWQSTWLSATPVTGTVSASGSNPLSVNVNATGLAVGSYQAYVRIVGNIPYAYGDEIVPVTMTISPKPVLTVTASGGSITYGTAPSITPQYSGFIDGDDASVLDTAPTCTAGAGPFTVAGSPYTTSCSGGVDNKYDFAYVNGSLTVTAKALDVTANNKSILFGDPEPSFDYAAVGFVVPDAFITVPTCSVVENPHTAAGTYTIACSGGDAGANYSIAYHNGQYVIGEKPVLTVTASGGSITYGTAPSITPQYSGFIDGDDAAVLDVAPTCTVGAGPFTVAGSPYTTSCSGGVDGKYDFSYVSGSLTVSAKALDVTANNKAIPFGDPEPTFDYTAVGFVVPDTFVTTPTCSVVENPHTAAGTYTIACAGGDAGANYSIAYHNGQYVIGEKPILTVTASGGAMIYGDAAPSITLTYSGFINGDDASVLDTAPTCTAGAGPFTVSGSPYTTSCSGGVDNKYDFSYVNGSLTVGPKALEVTANDKTISFGASEPAFDYTVVGFVAPDTFLTAPTCSVAEDPHTAVGTYTIACSGGDAGSNYSIAYHAGVYTIRPVLTVTASGGGITYGDAAPSITPQYSGFIDGDDAAVLDVAPTCSASAALTVANSPVATVCSGGVDGKYAFAYVDGSVTVGPKTLDITANDKTIKFGDPEPSFDYIAVGFVAPDAFVTAPTCSVVENPHTAAGTYTIACSGGNAGSNYSIAYHGGQFTISAKPVLTVTASGGAITYGDAAPSITPQYAGFVDGDDASVLDTAPTCSAGVGPFTVAGSPYATSCSGGSDSKYDFNYVNGSLTVAPKAISVTAVAKTKIYGAVDPALTYTFTPALVSGDSFSGSLSRASGENVGTYAIGQDSLSLGSNYTLNYTGANLSITQASLTATADDKSKFANQTDPDFTVSYSGFVNGDDSSVIDTAPTCSSSGDHSVVGTYPIVCSGGADNNYSFTYEDGLLTVNGPTFADVPFSYWANGFIERLYSYGVTGGCSTSPLNYCPNSNVTRASMAVFILRAKYGDAYVPPTATGTVFTDVPAGSFAAAYIEALYAEGITGGCGGGKYCPNKTITRAEMAVFILRGIYGNAYVPPTASGTMFDDVPSGYWAAAWIEAMAGEGITSGCGSNKFCPSNPVTRAEMAVFLVTAFNLP
jgi:hypothetical protein